MRRAKFCGIMAAVVLFAVAPLGATTTERWIVDTADEFLKGKGNGVAVHGQGRLEREPALDIAVTFEEPVAFAGALRRDGSVLVGTGHPAILYEIRGSKAKKLADIEAEQVTSILDDGSGDIYIATMAPGALFRYDGKKIEEVGRLGEGTIWDLILFDDRVVAAGGSPASLYRVTDDGLVRWLELPDAHARCMDRAGERLIVGTSGKGLILAVEKNGRIGLLSDSKFTEISDLVAVPDGSIWATAVVGEPEPPKAKKNGTNANTETGTMNLDLPKINGASASSEVLRLTEDGALLKVHHFSKQIASAIAWDGEAVLVGTGYEGEIWRFIETGGARVAALDAVQTVALLGRGAAALTQGPAQLLTRSDTASDVSRFRISALRLERPANFGEYRIEGAWGESRIRFRSGISEKPDPTWLSWSEWLDGSSGRVPLPAGQSLQWEVELTGKATVERVEVAYREVNIPPEIKEMTLEEPGVVYLQSPPPSGPVIDVSHPDASGIFTVLGTRSQSGPKRPNGKKYWRVGFQTVSWQVEDENKDPLTFKLEIEDEHGFRFLVRQDLKTTQLAVDTTSIPDGRYRFHLEASDLETNPGVDHPSQASSRWFDVDNTPPVIDIQGSADFWEVEIADEGSEVVRAEFSRDGESWTVMAPVDGICDGQRERFRIPRENGRHMLMIRTVDRHHNRNSAGVVED